MGFLDGLAKSPKPPSPLMGEGGGGGEGEKYWEFSLLRPPPLHPLPPGEGK